MGTVPKLEQLPITTYNNYERLPSLFTLWRYIQRSMGFSNRCNRSGKRKIDLGSTCERTYTLAILSNIVHISLH